MNKIVFLSMAFLLISKSSFSTDLSKFNVLDIRIASVSKSADDKNIPCLRIGVVILILQKSGMKASISTAYLTSGSWSDDIKNDFGQYKNIVFRKLTDKLSSMLPNNDNFINTMAQQVIDNIKPNFKYHVAPNVALSVYNEKVTNKIANDYFDRFHAMLQVIDQAENTLKFDMNGDPNLKNNLNKVLPGNLINYSVIIYNQAVILHFTPASVKIWFNAFIPAVISGTTISLSSGPYAGKTAIALVPLDQHPIRYYLTDSRDFNNNINSKQRVQVVITIDLQLAEITYDAHCDSTVGIDPATGNIACKLLADNSGINLVGQSFTKSNGVITCKAVLNARASNPCVIGASLAPIRINGAISIIAGTDNTIKLSFDGNITQFPAFEMYAQLNNNNSLTVFTESPSPGKSPLALLGSTDRVTISNFSCK